MKKTGKFLAYGALLASLGFGLLITVPSVARAQDQTLLNVSYDPTRELYEEYNVAFVKHWQATKGAKPQ